DRGKNGDVTRHDSIPLSDTLPEARHTLQQLSLPRNPSGNVRCEAFGDHRLRRPSGLEERPHGDHRLPDPDQA
ncbi:unnamed protein product, partial [Musa acuminata subsp. burmannicoides]